MTTFERIKTGLRLTGMNDLDDDIRLNISAALIDLASAGINVNDHTDDEAIVVAILLYCRWIYNQLDKGDQWFKAYEFKKQQLSLDSYYHVDGDNYVQ